MAPEGSCPRRTTPAGAEEAVRFLARFSPFRELEASQLDDIARHAELRSFPAGIEILQQAAQPAHDLFVLHRGVVELIADGHVIDQLGEGELFGLSVFSGLGPALSVRTREDVDCYLIDPGRARVLMGTPRGFGMARRADDPLAGTGCDRGARAPGRDGRPLPVADRRSGRSAGARRGLSRSPDVHRHAARAGRGCCRHRARRRYDGRPPHDASDRALHRRARGATRRRSRGSRSAAPRVTSRRSRRIRITRSRTRPAPTRSRSIRTSRPSRRR